MCIWPIVILIYNNYLTILKNTQKKHKQNKVLNVISKDPNTWHLIKTHKMVTYQKGNKTKYTKNKKENKLRMFTEKIYINIFIYYY